MRKRLLIVLGMIIAILLAVDIAGILLLREYSFVRYVSLAHFQDADSSQTTYDGDRSGLRPLNNDKRAIVLLQEVMNKVKKIGPIPPGDINAIIRQVSGGEGVACGGMAELYHYNLYEHGIKARIIQLQRDVGNKYDSHVTVEVYLNNRWVIFDPTFNVSYEKDGVLIGAQEIHQSLIDGTFNRIRPIFYGEVAYPARLDKYYMHWLSLYDNIFVPVNAKSAWLGKFPPFRYWYGPLCYYPEDGRSHDYHLQLHNKTYFIVVVVLPTALIGLILLFATLLIIEYHRKNRPNPPYKR